MDYAEKLRHEAKSSHAQFHQVTLALSKQPLDSMFLFFEGEDDPSFYIGKIASFLNGRSYMEYVCNGRGEVLQTQALLAGDKRTTGRVLFFIDKDDSDLTSPQQVLPASVYQTELYSFENFIACEIVFRRYWVERLHLSVEDARYKECKKKVFDCLDKSRKRLTLIALYMLVARGVSGRPKIPLNLRNVRLEAVLSVDYQAGAVNWQRGALNAFIGSSNSTLNVRDIRRRELHAIWRTHLTNIHPGTYIRGKFELWAFVKIIKEMTAELCDRAKCQQTGLKRATPREALSFANSVDTLGSLTPCPDSLAMFLRQTLG